MVDDDLTNTNAFEYRMYLNAIYNFWDRGKRLDMKFKKKNKTKQ